MRKEFIHKGQIDTKLLLPLCSAVNQALESTKHLSQFSNLARHSQKTRQTAGRLAAEPAPAIKSLPIHEAAKRFDLDALSRHLSADHARAVDEIGRTPLHWAARAGFDLGVVSLLPFLGIDELRLADFDGQSASDLARANHRPHLASMIDLFTKNLVLSQHEHSITLQAKRAVAPASTAAEAQYLKLQMVKEVQDHKQAMAQVAQLERTSESKLTDKPSKVTPSDEFQKTLDQRDWDQEKKYISRISRGITKI